MKHKKKMGVIGGMGPLATMDFATKVVRFTEASCDQEHIPMIIDNRIQIPDRTNYILNGTNSPLSELIASATFLEESGAEFLVMPCNTAHYFYNEIKKHIHIPFLHIVEETTKEILKHKDTVHKVALISTTGTYSCGLYQDAFAKQKDVDLLLPDEDGKSLIMDMLYAIKSGQPKNPDALMKLLDDFMQQGAQDFLLGCTEAPLLFDNYHISYPVFDSSSILAKSAITFACAES